MSGGFEKRMIPAAEWLVTGLASASILLGSFFAVALLIRGVDAAMGWHYHFQSIGDFLGIQRPRKVVAWDRSFLLLAGALVTGSAGTGVQGFIDWAQQSPEQRRRARERAKEAHEKQQQLDAVAKAARKAARKLMSGWRRLWIVLSVLFGGTTYIVTYDAYSRASAEIPYNGDKNAFWQRAEKTRALGDCDWSTAKAEYPLSGSYLVTCQNQDPWLFASLWALVPGLVMAGIGLIMRWIYRGFRRPQKQPSETH
jgi:hypothetical protein